MGKRKLGRNNMWRTKLFPLFKYRIWNALNRALQRYMNLYVEPNKLYSVIADQYVVIIIYRK